MSFGADHFVLALKGVIFEKMGEIWVSEESYGVGRFCGALNIYMVWMIFEISAFS